jgi:hypothetical protein
VRKTAELERSGLPSEEVRSQSPLRQDAPLQRTPAKWLCARDMPGCPWEYPLRAGAGFPRRMSGSRHSSEQPERRRWAQSGPNATVLRPLSVTLAAMPLKQLRSDRVCLFASRTASTISGATARAQQASQIRRFLSWVRQAPRRRRIPHFDHSSPAKRASDGIVARVLRRRGAPSRPWNGPTQALV